MIAAKIFRYVVQYDGGTAPRPFGGVCSLAICKPRIRAKAQVGDWVVGFRSRHPGEVLYAMQVTERLTLGEYWEDFRFRDRRPGASPYPDNFYQPTRDGGLVQVPNLVHVLGDTAKDCSGLHVLLSDRYWYFGRNSVPLPNHLLHLVHTTQGHAVHIKRRPDDANHLREWLAHWPTGRLGQPLNDRGEVHPAPPPTLAESASSPAIAEAFKSQPPKVRRSCSTALRQTKAAGPRRIVLSRKGFDSGYGGIPSPILPDGRLLPLPIPATHDAWTMGDLRVDDVELAPVLHDLSKGRHSLASRIHLDPDLDRAPAKRLEGWRPSLGQTGAAQSHLERSGVGRGDVFLFFGWFRRVERVQARWRYVRSAPNLHVLFGWLEVDEVLPVVRERARSLEAHPWIADHPHVENPAHYTDVRNTLYIAPSESRILPGNMGGGLFPHFAPGLQLTIPGRSRSMWRLPAWMMPQAGQAPLSYHNDARRWSMDSEGCTLQTVAKGQEFVLSAEQYPESLPWLRSVLSSATDHVSGSTQ